MADRNDIDRPAAEEAGVYYYKVRTIVGELEEKEFYETKIIFLCQTRAKI